MPNTFNADGSKDNSNSTGTEYLKETPYGVRVSAKQALRNLNQNMKPFSLQGEEYIANKKNSENVIENMREVDEENRAERHKTKGK